MKHQLEDPLPGAGPTESPTDFRVLGGAPSFAAIEKPHIDTLLRRKAVAAALTAIGFPTSDATLATKATRGGGPPYRLFGRVPLYRWGDALEWANGRLSDPLMNTSAAQIAKHRGSP